MIKHCLLVAILLTSVFSPAWAKSKDKIKTNRSVANTQTLVKDFKKATGLIDGEYSLGKGVSEACYDGLVEVFVVDDYLSLMIGGQLLASEFVIGKKETAYEESGCKNTVLTSLNEQTLISQHTQVCEKRKETLVVNKSVKFSSGKLDYTIKSTLNGKARNNVTCSLVLK